MIYFTVKPDNKLNEDGARYSGIWSQYGFVAFVDCRLCLSDAPFDVGGYAERFMLGLLIGTSGFGRLMDHFGGGTTTYAYDAQGGHCDGVQMWIQDALCIAEL